MLFKITLSDKREITFEAKNTAEAKKIANKKYSNWEALCLLHFIKERKSDALDKRQWVQKSKKIYNRTKAKRRFKKKLREGEY